MKIKIQHISIFFFLLLFLSISIKLYAQESLEKYLEIAASNNPEVKASFDLYLAALEKVPQVGSHS